MNEERNIAGCLDSVVGWADDVVVVDSGSTDRTIPLCAERGIEPIFHAYTDHRSQIQWAMTSVPWKHDWFLLLDADSIVTPELKDQVDAMVQSDDGTIHGYYTAHQRYFRNRPVRGVTTQRLLLIRRSRVRVDESELVDFRFVVNGPTGTLPGAIIESNQNELEIDFWIDKHQKFARRTAIEQILREENVLGWSRALRPRPFGSLDERIIWLKNIWYDLPLYVRPVLLFLYRYGVRGGFLDGWNGFVFHAFQAFWFRLLVDIHVDEYRLKLRQRAMSLDDLLRLAGRNPAERATGEAL
jgi:glycosyltransferase involved in cell wall biosynthesis